VRTISGHCRTYLIAPTTVISSKVPTASSG
jgi:hypothetical protein